MTCTIERSCLSHVRHRSSTFRSGAGQATVEKGSIIGQMGQLVLLYCVFSITVAWQWLLIRVIVVCWWQILMFLSSWKWAAWTHHCTGPDKSVWLNHGLARLVLIAGAIPTDSHVRQINYVISAAAFEVLGLEDVSNVDILLGARIIKNIFFSFFQDEKRTERKVLHI